MPTAFSCMLSVKCFLMFIQHFEFNTMNSGNFLPTFFHDAILLWGLLSCHITVVLDISGNVKRGLMF